MKRNQKIIGICSAALVLLLILLILLQSEEPRCSRKVEENLFSLDMERLNGTIAEPFSLKEGDTVDVSLVRISGELSIAIGQENREPVYAGKNPELNFFRVTVPEDGEYLFSVSGKHAEGSICFEIGRTAGTREVLQNRPTLRSVD